MPAPRHSRRRRGAAALEFAVVAPLALFLVFAQIVGSLGVSRYQEVAHLAREGARYASTHGGMYQREGIAEQTGVPGHRQQQRTAQLSCGEDGSARSQPSPGGRGVDRAKYLHPGQHAGLRRHRFQPDPAGPKGYPEPRDRDDHVPMVPRGFPNRSGHTNQYFADAHVLLVRRRRAPPRGRDSVLDSPSRSTPCNPNGSENVRSGGAGRSPS
jgi:hypothetical protein